MRLRAGNPMAIQYNLWIQSIIAVKAMVDILIFGARCKSFELDTGAGLWSSLLTMQVCTKLLSATSRNHSKKAPTPVRQFHLGMTCLKAGNQELGQQLIRSAAEEDPNLGERVTSTRLVNELHSAKSPS